MNKLVLLVTLVPLLVAPTAGAAALDVPTASEMRTAAEGWLAAYVERNGGWPDSTVVLPRIADVLPLAAGDTLLGVVFSVEPEGWLLLPATRDLRPISAFSTRGRWHDRSPGAACGHTSRLLRRSYDRALHDGRDDAARADWAALLEGKTEREIPVLTISAGPLMADILWGQCFPYNLACPPVPLLPECPSWCQHHCLLGCPASSLSRLLRFHEYPSSGNGTESYPWDGDDFYLCPFPGAELSADFGAAIDWNHLPPSCQSCSPEDSVALADFCYRVAVGLHMDFGRAASASDFPAEQTLVTHYEYPNTMVRIPFSDPLAFAQIRDEINARRPLRVTLLFTASHYLNFDGWGLEEDGDRWYHANDDGGGAWWSEPSLNLDDDALGGIRSPLVVESVLVTPDGVGGDYPNIQAAVDAVPDGCRIVLADGTFRGAGNRDIDFHGKEVTVGSASGDPATCIIDCEGSPTNPHRGFYFHTAETGASVVRDITVTGGYVT